MGQVIVPFALIRHLLACQNSFPERLVIAHFSLIIGPVLPNEQSLATLSEPIPETAFVKGSIIINKPTCPMRQSVFPVSVIVGSIFEQIK